MSKKYPAIDGLENKATKSLPIRSDVEVILNMRDPEFEKWYTERKEATQSLMEQYKLFSTIPHLEYSSEKQRLTMAKALAHVGHHLATFKEGIDYLEKIKEKREELNSQ